MTASPIRAVFDHRIFAVQAHGGISRYFAGIAPLLAAHGCDVRIIAPLHHNAYLPDLPNHLVFGQKISGFRGSRSIAMQVDDALARPLAALHGARIVHETYYGERRLAPRGTAVVLTVYDMIHELFPDVLDDPVTCARKAAAIARADRILCISHSTLDDLVRFFPAAAPRASVTLLGFDGRFAAAPGPAAGTRPYLLYVGERSGYKNFAALLSAYAASLRLTADFDLVCIGGGPFRSVEAAAISAHGLAGKVRQHAAGDAALRRWYGGAVAFVYPSLYEGFGIPPLEAMAADCPVIAVPRSSVPEVCGPAAQYAADGSAEALRAAIEEVVYNPARAAELRRAGQARLGLFAWDNTAAQTADCYRELA